MSPLTTYYFSQLLGLRISTPGKDAVGKIHDLLILNSPDLHETEESFRPRVVAIKTGTKSNPVYLDFRHFEINKINGRYKAVCRKQEQISQAALSNFLALKETILDQQIVDLNGRKLVRVNDIRIASIPTGTFVVAVDVGVEGLLRRLGVSKLAKSVAAVFNLQIPSKFILWDEVDTLDASNLNIKLSKSYAKLQTLHPSDLADIIEDLGRKASAEVFSALDEEKAADVMEELDTETQVHILESLSIEKAADVLDKMPADEVADILDALEDEKAELLLNEMEKDTSQEVRELLVYPDHTVGSIMSSEVMSFNQHLTMEEVLTELRDKKPESETLYNLFVTDDNEVLLATFSIRDVVITPPEVQIRQIMKPSPVHLRDYQKINEVAEIVSKYNLLAIPVVDKKNVLKGMVVIDDVIEDLIRKRRTNK